MKIKASVNTNAAYGRIAHLTASFLMAALVIAIFVGAAKAGGLSTISPEQANILIGKERGSPDFVILDIRTQREFKAGHIEGAELIDFYSKDFLKKMRALDKNKIYLIYCRSANRSAKTLQMIKDMGFTLLYNMDRGLNGWRQKGFAIVK